MTASGSSGTTADLLIVGACVRAAVQSAIRAGRSTIAADRYLDEDLRRLCPVVEVSSYPADLHRAVGATAARGWIYTGALENYPDLVERLAALRPLYGNSAEVLRAVRDPQRLATALENATLRAPRIALNPRDVPTDGTWLRKPLRSAGGAGIHPWLGGTHHERFYYQQRISGSPCSAVFAAAGGDACLLGVTRQLIGEDWTGARGFAYSGSISLGPVTESRRQQLQTIGGALSRAFGLVGLFGVDLIDGPGGFWPIEVNPRYTASVEVIERASTVQAIDLHINACMTGTLPTAEIQQRGYAGKAIIYATRDVTIPAAFTELVRKLNPAMKETNPAATSHTLAATRSGASPTIRTGNSLNLQSAICNPQFLADIPRIGSTIPTHAPVTTVLAAGSDPADVERQLRDLASQVQRLYA